MAGPSTLRETVLDHRAKKKPVIALQKHSEETSKMDYDVVSNNFQEGVVPQALRWRFEGLGGMKVDNIRPPKIVSSSLLVTV